jgi:hypothetical protein
MLELSVTSSVYISMRETLLSTQQAIHVIWLCTHKFKKLCIKKYLKRNCVLTEHLQTSVSSHYSLNHILQLFTYVYIILGFISNLGIFFGNAVVWIQKLALTRQMLYYFFCAPHLFCFSYFWIRSCIYTKSWTQTINSNKCPYA